MIKNHSITAIWIGIVAALWCVIAGHIGIHEAWPGFLVSCMTMLEGPRVEIWAKAQISALIGLGCSIILVPWIGSWQHALGLGIDATVFLVILLIVAVLVFISSNVPRIINASMVFISFAANFGAIEKVFGPKAHPGEMFLAWLIGGAFMSLGIIYGLMVLHKIKLIKTETTDIAH